MRMSLKEFVKEVFENNQEELDKIRKFREIMNQLRREETEIYVVSVTSDL